MMELEAYRSQNNKEIIILDDILKVGDKIYTSNTIAHCKSVVKIKYLDEENVLDNPKVARREVTFVINGKEDEEKWVNMLYDDKLFNRIECPNQVREMLVGEDEESTLLAYDFLRLHSRELSGSILLQ